VYDLLRGDDKFSLVHGRGDRPKEATRTSAASEASPGNGAPGTAVSVPGAARRGRGGLVRDLS